MADISVSMNFAEPAVRGREPCSLAASASGRLSMNFQSAGGSASYSLSNAEARLSWNGPPVDRRQDRAAQVERAELRQREAGRRDAAKHVTIEAERGLALPLAGFDRKPAWVSASKSRRMVRSDTPSPATLLGLGEGQPAGFPLEGQQNAPLADDLGMAFHGNGN